MLKVLCSLYDKVQCAYGAPFVVPLVGVAYRYVGDMLRQPGEDNMLRLHPGDFELYTLGMLDDETGEVMPELKLLCAVSSLVTE